MTWDDVLNVNAPGGEVGCDENAEAATLEALEGGGALRLRAIAVDHGGVDAVAIQALGNAFSASLGAGKDQAAAGFFAKKMIEHGLFCRLRALQRLAGERFPRA